MRRLAALRPILLATIAACTTTSRSTDGPLAGLWISLGPSLAGTALVLEPRGGALGGRFLTRFAAYPLDAGEISAGEVSFLVSVEADPVAGHGQGDAEGMTPIRFRGRLAGDRLELDVEMPKTVQRGHLVARRASAEESARVRRITPARIEPPPLRDLADNGLARTPPMGWNSWNHFALGIDDKTVRGVAAALVETGMRDAGYVYVVIDDGWQGARARDGTLHPNAKFPDMKALADHLHARGLKLGIYSSPGPLSCGGFEGSYGHEEQDARTFAAWGIDYLKYDWCSAGGVYRIADMRAVYQKMAQGLRATGRAIVFSICQYGLGGVWAWGPRAGGNLWRTTGDIADSWRTVATIGLAQGPLAPFAGPGHWNDPDMLEVGNGGMNAVEYRSHMTLWALLAAPLMAGNDLREASPETIAILTNREVVAIDQDALGRQGERVRQGHDSEVWVKPLSGERYAVGLFNLGAEETTLEVHWSDLGLEGALEVRDAWAGEDRGTFVERFSATVPAHGVALLVVRR